MKKVLFASTALIATAGVAAADVSFGGYGRFGFAEDFAGNNGQYSRIRLQIDMSTEADNGMKVGARLRHQVTKGPANNSLAPSAVGWGFNTARFYATMGGLTVAMGNIGGAIEFMPSLYLGGTQSAGVGLSGLGFTNLVTNTNTKGYWGWDAYSSAGGGATNRDGIEVMYSQGDFGAHLSYSDDVVMGERVAVHFSYSMSGWTVALGMQDSDVMTEDKTVLTARGSLGNTNLQFGVADNDGTTKWMVGANFEVGAATRVDAFVTSEEGMMGGETWGLGVSHNLGGGVSVEAGVVENTAGDTAADIGIRFNF